MNFFQRTVSALVYSSIQERCPRPRENRYFLNNQVVNFVLGQHTRMPDYLRLPLSILTIIFGLRTVLSAGKPFHRLSHEQRWWQIERWRTARLQPLRDLMRFYDSLAVYGWYALYDERVHGN